MMRPLPMVFPKDKEAVYWEDEYFYGSDLLAAPVHQEGEQRRIYFPAGRWINLLDFRKMVGGNRILQVDVPIDKITICITKISTFLILCDLAVCLATLYVSFSLVLPL